MSETVLIRTPRVSVITPTFDRVELLPRLYESLAAQTAQSFEWVVIDDGSSDGTEALVSRWAADSPFPIAYRRQPNRGKHVALNRAFEVARGEYLAMIDSDDAYLPHALERLLAVWETIPAGERERFVSVEARCRLADGTIVGKPPPAPVLDSDYFEIWAVHGAGGDSVGMLRAAALSGYRFPEGDDGVVVTESLLWHRIALRYRTRFVDEVLKVNHYQATGLSARADTAWRRDARPMRSFYGDILAMPRPMPLRVRSKAAANYLRYSLHARVAAGEIWSDAGSHRPLLVLAAPVGAGAYLRDRVQSRRSSF